MESVWFTADLADEILRDEEIFKEIHNIVTDIVYGKLEITRLVENMAGVLTNVDPENRVKGMTFFTKLLNELPKEYFTEMQVKFISKFYADRLRDNHRVIPMVLEGYLCIVEMGNYDMENCREFFMVLFREVPCQSQVRQDRFRIYKIIQCLLVRNVDFLKTLGPDFVYGVISAIDGERDPRNLIFLFNFLPKFISSVSVGHLVEEMFDVISCYYPIDFHASPDDPLAVTRQELADALAPCLCAIPEFGDLCLVLLIEKLDSSLRLAKIDSLKLLVESCKTFNVQTYTPFVKTIWSSIRRELSHKTDGELKMVAFEALSALTKKLSSSANTDQLFESYVKGIIISMQTEMAESTTVIQFVQATKVLLTVANASKESCLIVVKTMIPAAIAYFGFNTTSKLQIASLDFLADLTELAKHWNVVNEVEPLIHEIPHLCLAAVSNHGREFQIAGFRTLIRIKDWLKPEVVLPFVEVLIHNVQHSQNPDLLTKSIETIHALARKYPELIMELVVKQKCDFDNLTKDKKALSKRLDLLCNLASIDEFTKVIIEEMLAIINSNDKEDANKVLTAMSCSISDSMIFTEHKIAQIESDHGLIESVLAWLINEISQSTAQESLAHGYTLISNAVCSIAIEKQRLLIEKHTDILLQQVKKEEVYFLILEALYNSLRQSLYEPKFLEVMRVSLELCLKSEQDIVRAKACILVAHFLNKAGDGDEFDALYGVLRDKLSSCSHDEEKLCSNLIFLCGWLTKSLIMRGSDLFLFWLRKIIIAISSPEWCNNGAESIRLIVTDTVDYLNPKCHCRTTLLYKQRMFQTYMTSTENFEASSPDVKQAYLLSWAYILAEIPKTVLVNEVDKISPLVIDSLEYESMELLSVMVDVLSHLVRTKQKGIADSLQTILPRLINLSKYVNSMDVRIKSLECLYEIANCYPTMLLLPYKQDLLFDLGPALDDRKRLVRNMAVRARTRWFLIGSPGEAAN